MFLNGERHAHLHITISVKIVSEYVQWRLSIVGGEAKQRKLDQEKIHVSIAVNINIFINI